MFCLPKAAGVGLRTPHIQTILEQKPAMPWFELMSMPLTTSLARKIM